MWVCAPAGQCAVRSLRRPSSRSFAKPPPPPPPLPGPPHLEPKQKHTHTTPPDRHHHVDTRMHARMVMHTHMRAQERAFTQRVRMHEPSHAALCGELLNSASDGRPPAMQALAYSCIQRGGTSARGSARSILNRLVLPCSYYGVCRRIDSKQVSPCSDSGLGPTQAHPAHVHEIARYARVRGQ